MLLLLWILVQTETVQNWVVKRVTRNLSRSLQTEVSVGRVSFTLFNRMNLEKTLVRDRQKDTLLYAGSLKVRITDWFFFKDNIELKYIGLEDAVIKMQRRDSVWNYQFIADHFSTPPAARPETGRQVVLDFKKIDLKNVSFLQNDLWVGQRLVLSVGSMLMDADRIDLVKNRYIINELELDKAVYSNFDMEGLRPPRVRKASKREGFYFNEGNIYAEVRNLKLTNSSFIDDKLHGRRADPYFDGRYIVFQKISGDIRNLVFRQDTITAQLNLSARERSGLEVRDLDARFRLTPEIMEFRNLRLRTGKSELRDYYAMSYRDFNRDMADYISQVVMTARFRNSEVHTDDIAYFAPELKHWNQLVALSGRFRGTVADFRVQDLFLRSGRVSYVAGDLTMSGLPDINSTQITLQNGLVQTNYQEALAYIPSLKEVNSPDLRALGIVRYVGTFNGTINDFYTRGNLVTALGGISADISMQLPAGADARYRGRLDTRSFDLGRFIHEPLFGRISFRGQVSGTSFALDRLRTTIDGRVDQLGFNGYTYTNLLVNGTFQKKYFTGEFKADDPHFNFTSSIEIDVTGRVPRFNILGDLVRSDLRALRFTDDDYQLTGLFDLNFSGRNIDEFLGSAKVLNAVLTKDSMRIDFDSLAVHSFHEAGLRTLSLQSNQVEAQVRGQYSIMQLPQAFKAFLHRYYPSVFEAPKKDAGNQQFDFTVQTRNFSSYLSLLHRDFSGLNHASIRGRINTQTDSGFALTATVPDLYYRGYALRNMQLEATGTRAGLDIRSRVADIAVSDSLRFPNSTVTIHSQNDHSRVNIATRANNTLNEAQLNADVHTFSDGVRINFLPSSFVINDKRWILEKEGELVLSRSFVSAKNVKFSQGFQEIAVETLEEEGGTANNLAIKLRNLNLGDFTPFLTREPRMEGIGTGEVHLRDVFGRFSMDGQLRMDQFRLDDDSVGVVMLTGRYDDVSKKATFTALSKNEEFSFDALGSYDLQKGAGTPLQVKMHLRDTRIGFLNRYLSGVFTDVKGLANGEITVSGNPNAPDIVGTVRLSRASLKVNYTQVSYYIDDAQVVFREGAIDFGSFRVRDRNNNQATVRGVLYQRGFRDLRYDFTLAADRLLVLNTQERDNDNFYGQAIGKVNMTLRGPEDNLYMNIAGEVNDTTHIFIPPTNTRESGEADFIVFKQYGREMQEVRRGSSRLVIDLDLIANNQAQIDVILDDLAGDVIRATGYGRIRMHIDNGDVTMNGRYTIERGVYSFNFQSFIKKPFELRGGENNYIEWTGDPLNARINLEAQYTASNISLNDLIGGTNVQLASAAQAYRGDVYVIAALTGMLNAPKIDFRLDFPSNVSFRNDDTFAQFLNKLESDQTEMLKQVTMLIVFGQFVPFGGMLSGTNYRSFGVNTISQMVTSEINKVVSNLLFKLTGDKRLQFDISASTYSSGGLFSQSAGTGTNSNSQLDRQRVKLNLNQRFFNDKVIVTVGGDLDFSVNSSVVSATGNFQWLPDISVQVVLSRDRKIRAVIFNKSSLDVSNASQAFGRRNRQGISITYSRDFEKLFARREEPLKASPPRQGSGSQPE